MKKLAGKILFTFFKNLLYLFSTEKSLGVNDKLNNKITDLDSFAVQLSRKSKYFKNK